MKNQAFFENIQQVISTELLKAKKTIYVAVAWFTDTRLLKILEEKAKQGIKIKVLFVADEINDKSSVDFSDLESFGGKVFPLDTNKLLMHNKFCVIDNKTVITGSYNWTNKAANSNLENIMLITGNADVCEQYQNNFDAILSEYFDEDFSDDYHNRLKPTWQKYKFHNEEYSNFRELSATFSQNQIKWKDAQEHFKEGYIQKWLEEINDFDTIIQLNKARSYSNDLEFQIAYLVYFADKRRDFYLLGYKINFEKLLSILIKSRTGKLKNEELYIIELLRNGRLAHIIKMYLLAKGKEDDFFYKSINFIGNSNINKQKSNDSLIRYLEWRIDSSQFIPFNTFYYDDLESVMRNEEVDKITDKYYVTQSILDKLYSSKREDMLVAVKDLRYITGHTELEKEKLKSFLDNYILPKDFFSYIEEKNINTLLSIIRSQSFDNWDQTPLLPKDSNYYFNNSYFDKIKDALHSCAMTDYLEYSKELVLNSFICLVESPEILYGINCEDESIRKIAINLYNINRICSGEIVNIYEYLNNNEGLKETLILDTLRSYFMKLYQSDEKYNKFRENFQKRTILTNIINSYFLGKLKWSHEEKIAFLNLDEIWEIRYDDSFRGDNHLIFLFLLPIKKSIIKFDKLGFDTYQAFEKYVEGVENRSDYLDINGNIDYIACAWNIIKEKIKEDDEKKEKKRQEYLEQERQKAEQKRLEQIRQQEAEEKEKRRKEDAFKERIETLKRQGLILSETDMTEIIVIKNKLEGYCQSNHSDAYIQAIDFLKDVICLKKCSKDSNHELINEIINIVNKHEKSWFSNGIANKIAKSLAKIQHWNKYIEIT